MDHEDGLEDEGPIPPLLPPDDRLWRHPSEVASSPPPAGRPVAAVARHTARVWPVALVAGLVGALLASGIGLAVGEFSPTTLVRPVTNQVVPDAVSASVQNQPNWPAILDNLSPSVVTVTADGPSGESVTSGVMWGTEGTTSFVLTDAYSVAGASEVRVQIPAGGASLPAHLVGLDQVSGIAVVAIKGSRLPAAFMGSVSELQTGETVDIVASEGAVSGSAGGPVSTGVVSGTDLELQASDAPTLLGMVAIATSGPDQSGAAVVDPNGAVVGITTSLSPADASGAGTVYAVPIDIAVRVANSIIYSRNVSHPWLGVTEAGDLPTATANQLGVAGGAVIEQESSAGPAAAAGLKTGDVVTSVNGAPVTSAASLLLRTDSCQVNHRVVVGYFDNGRHRQAELRVAEQPQTVLP